MGDLGGLFQGAWGTLESGNLLASGFLCRGPGQAPVYPELFCSSLPVEVPSCSGFVSSLRIPGLGIWAEDDGQQDTAPWMCRRDTRPGGTGQGWCQVVRQMGAKLRALHRLPKAAHWPVKVAPLATLREDSRESAETPQTPMSPARAPWGIYSAHRPQLGPLAFRACTSTSPQYSTLSSKPCSRLFLASLKHAALRAQGLAGPCAPLPVCETHPVYPSLRFPCEPVSRESNLQTT